MGVYLNINNVYQPVRTDLQQPSYGINSSTAQDISREFSSELGEDFDIDDHLATLPAQDPSSYISRLRASRRSYGGGLNLQQEDSEISRTTSASASAIASETVSVFASMRDPSFSSLGLLSTISVNRGQQHASSSYIRGIVAKTIGEKSIEYVDECILPPPAAIQRIHFNPAEVSQSLINCVMSARENLVIVGAVQVYQGNLTEEVDPYAVFHEYVVRGSTTIVNFIGCSINARIMPDLILALGRTKHLDELNLSSNAIDDNAAHILARHLRTDMHLNILDLTNNPIGQTGIDYLKKAVSENPHKIILRGLV